MTKNTRFSPEVRQRAVRMVLESQSEYDSQWATICSIAPKIGCTPETLRVWVRQHGVSLDIENYCTLSLFFVHMRYGIAYPPKRPLVLSHHQMPLKH